MRELGLPIACISLNLLSIDVMWMTLFYYFDLSLILFFLNYLNSQHNSIQFTHEIERSHTVPFLDVLVTKSSEGFKTGLHRKPTVTGLGFKFDSAITDFLQI